MNTALRSILAAGILLALGSTVAAQGRPHGEGPHHERGPVNIEEARQRITEHAAAMDADGDGQISVDERRAFHESRRAERMERMMARRGIDPDAKVAIEDFIARRIAWLESLDVNGDGVVDAEEMKAGREQRRSHRHGMKRGDRGPQGE